MTHDTSQYRTVTKLAIQKYIDECNHVYGSSTDREEAIFIREDEHHWAEIGVYQQPTPLGPAWFIAWFGLPDLLQGKRSGYGRRYYELWESQLPSEVDLIYLAAINVAVPFWTAMGYKYVFENGEDSGFMIKSMKGRDLDLPLDDVFIDDFEPEEYGPEVNYVPDTSQLKKANAGMSYLYHVSLLTRLDSIATSGLFPGRSENWPGYSSHAKGRVFLTEQGAVNEWIHKVTYSAAIDSDRPVEEGFIPVVLRVPLQQVEEFLHKDERGSRDVLSGDSYYVESTVHPDELEVYTPSGWVDVDDVDVDEMIEHAVEHATRDEYDGEVYVLLDEYVFAPDPGSMRLSWGETTNVFMVHTCGRTSILPECEGAEGFSLLPVGKQPKTKRDKKSKSKAKKGGVMVYRDEVYRQAEGSFKEPTEEMLAFFKQRTQDHINRVVRCMHDLEGFQELSTDELSERALVHDEDKYTDPELVLPYVWVTEYYRVKNEEGKVPEDLQAQYDQANEATGKHVKQNPHHPEAHGSIEDMTELDLAEMVCDWAAMAEELGQDSARGWADDNVGTKWEFSKDQTQFIYAAIDRLEGKNDA